MKKIKLAILSLLFLQPISPLLAAKGQKGTQKLTLGGISMGAALIFGYLTFKQFKINEEEILLKPDLKKDQKTKLIKFIKENFKMLGLGSAALIFTVLGINFLHDGTTDN